MTVDVAKDQTHSSVGDGADPTDALSDLSKPDVTTKYRTASDLTNGALLKVIEACVDGADIADVCNLGDKFIEEKTAGMYNKKVEGAKVKKGVAFPTCISVNEIAGCNRPFKNESSLLKAGDLCKIDLGCHIDGFIAVGAHTIVVKSSDGSYGPAEAPEDQRKKIIGRKADVLLAAWFAAQAALRTVKVGKTNKEVTDIMNVAIDQYNCQPVRGVRSHQLKQHVIDGSQVIISKETAEEKVDQFEFLQNEVYAIDVLVSSGDGKTKESDLRTTVYKRDTELNYKLKTQIGRKFFHEVQSRFPFLPFTATVFEDARMARAGVSECARYDLLIPYPVVVEKAGEYIAKFKFTVLLLPGGTKQVTGLPLTQLDAIHSEYSIKDEALKEILAKSVSAKSKSKHKKPVTDKVVDEVPQLQAA